MTRTMALVLAAGCNGPADDDPTDGGSGSGTPSTYGFDCPVTGSALPDPKAAIADPHSCEDDSPFPEQPAATTFFAGDFAIDCGSVTGHEYWVLYANPPWVDLGGHDCTVVWTVTGAVGEPVAQGDLSLTIHAEVDLEATSCSDIDGFDPNVAYEESFDQVYDVLLGGDTSSFYFTLESTSHLADGAANANHLTYLSTRKCAYF